MVMARFEGDCYRETSVEMKGRQDTCMALIYLTKNILVFGQISYKIKRDRNYQFHPLGGVECGNSSSYHHTELHLARVLALSSCCFQKVAVPRITSNDSTRNPGCFIMQAASWKIINLKGQEKTAIGRISRMVKVNLVA